MIQENEPETLVHVVIQVGVYRHSICGVYLKAEDAIACACRTAKADRDSYHEYHVIPCVLDGDGEGPEVFRCSKRDARLPSEVRPEQGGD